jgi:hypothetical protein
MRGYLAAFSAALLAAVLGTPTQGGTAERIACEVYPCKARSALSKGARAAEFVRSDGARPSAAVRLAEGARRGALLLSVLGPARRALAGPAVVSRSSRRTLPVFWAELNGDGREDFVALAVAGTCEHGCVCDVAFALSTSGGYAITPLRPTVDLSARSFVALGGGRCGFVHASVVERPGGRGRALVEDLLEFRGGRVLVSETHADFPRVAAGGPSGAGAPTAAESQELARGAAARVFRPESGGITSAGPAGADRADLALRGE